MLDVPAADVSGGFDAAARLSRCSATASQAVSRWEATAAPGWAGEAAVGFDDARAVLSRCVRDTVAAGEALSGAVDRYCSEMSLVLPRWRAAVAEWERARAGELSAVDPVAAGQAVFDAEVAVSRWHGRAEEAGAQLSAAAAGAVAQLVPYSPAWAQVEEGVRTFVRLAIVEPVQDAGFLALGWAWDRPRWSRHVESMPAAAGRAVEQAARHPWDTFRSSASAALGVEHFQAGRWGAGLGTALGGAIGAGRLRNPLKGQPVEPGTLARFPNAAYNRDRLPPKVQTLDEILADGVDLDRHEHTDLGHTLRRHVEVDDDYLEDRMRHGTILDDGRRGDIPESASAWTDRATAEASITHAVRINEAEVRAFASSSGVGGIRRLFVSTAEPVGRSMQHSSSAGPNVVPVSSFVVVLRRTADGVMVETAYPKAPK